MDENIRKMIIIDNYNNPNNKGLINDDSYYKVNMNSLSCIDNLDFMVKIENDIITDIKFDGEACVISTSASSIMTNLLIGKNIDEIMNIIDNYEAMINEKDYDEKLLEEALVFSDVAKQPNRKKCAMLPYEGIKKVILDLKEKYKNE